ncbi:hypothetical protein CIB84_001102 [Bambusicola thoracicus]|uniref:Leucine-rich repeat-containing protein 56 n=1 Tax=Bambusicola thoracicus TaxID=9083 RepID=A0A2P4TFL8_BAMTH|nr:hypothetical protein CIB84_001102 [Bambusicola thoracicus]
MCFAESSSDLILGKRTQVLSSSVHSNRASVISFIRDLGTTLSHLQVLWMACCGLLDLDGISACSSLKVLDLEGNDIEDINQMQYLGLCCKLSSLTVEGNLICLKPSAESAEELDYNYRAEVKKLIPHLEYLDGIPASQTAVPPSCKMNEDWLIIKESIKEGGLPRDVSWLGTSDFPSGFIFQVMKCEKESQRASWPFQSQSLIAEK